MTAPGRCGSRHTMKKSAAVSAGWLTKLIAEDQADFGPERTRYDPAVSASSDTMVYRIRGALFFGATAALGPVLGRIGSHPKVLRARPERMPPIDSTAANTRRGFVGKLNRGGTRVYVAGARTAVRRTLINAALRPPQVAGRRNRRVIGLYGNLIPGNGPRTLDIKYVAAAGARPPSPVSHITLPSPSFSY